MLERVKHPSVLPSTGGIKGVLSSCDQGHLGLGSGHRRRNRLDGHLVQKGITKGGATMAPPFCCTVWSRTAVPVGVRGAGSVDQTSPAMHSLAALETATHAVTPIDRSRTGSRSGKAGRESPSYPICALPGLRLLQSSSETCRGDSLGTNMAPHRTAPTSQNPAPM